MGAITTADGLLAALRAPQPLQKQTVNPAAGLYSSLWTAAGTPGAGSAPATGSGQVCTAATPGALPLPALSAGQDVYLAGLTLSAVQVSTVQVIDRLVASSGLNGTLATAQTVNTVALPNRSADAVGVQLALEWYTATGATAVTATVSYTNSDGVAGRTATVSVPASAPAGRFLPLALQAGDKGVASVQSVTLSATTGTAGSFGVTLYRPVATLGLTGTNVAVTLDWLALGLPDVGSASTSSACLALVHLCTGTGTGWIAGQYTPAAA